MKRILFLLCTPLFALTIQVSPNSVMQGQTVLVTVRSAVTVKNITFQNKNIPLYLVTTNSYESYVGTAYDTPTGTYTVRCGAQNTRLAIRSASFKKDIILVPEAKEKEGATDFEELSQEAKIIGAAFRTQTSQRYWHGVFHMPIKKYMRISSPYGAQRFYKTQKGKTISWWVHRGMDFATPTGNVVYATNDGIILVAQKFQVHGNTVIIDHGQGVLSVYNHLDRLVVQKHEKVKKGQWIGYSGNTGLTSGPHLHYGLSVNNTRVNPSEWFKKVW